jgi:hypothetical protein
MSTYSIYQIDGMITPADRSGNRYMVNFIDKRSGLSTALCQLHPPCDLIF